MNNNSLLCKLSNSVNSQINPNQFGVIPKSSTSMAAISMIHNWSQSTDSSGAAVRIVLFDYKKASNQNGAMSRPGSLKAPLGGEILKVLFI